LNIIDHLKKVIKASGRKSYFFVMGKLNVAKMANFMEIDCYVLVSCPENSLIDSKVCKKQEKQKQTFCLLTSSFFFNEYRSFTAQL
jgi:diphthamide biosynthesis enzyme Dph1/Dph2-like protein